jgi:hypothetical protein
VELAHLSVRFVEDTPTEPAGQAFPSGIHSGIVPRQVESVQVKDGFEDDRTRVVQSSSISVTPSGPVDGAPTATMMRALSRDAGDVRIQTAQALPPLRPPRPGFGVRDLVSTSWGARVLLQGALLAMVVFLITVLPMLSWFTGVTGPVPNGLLVRMLAAPLLAALAAGLMVASLIARTTARGLGRDDESQA